MTDVPRPTQPVAGTGRRLGETLIEIWRQVLVESLPAVDLGDQKLRVGHTGSLGLRTVALRVGSLVIEGIEQNPNTKSRWAQLAQEGKRIMQYRSAGRYVGNVCDGQLTRYPAWTAQGLPD